MSLPTNGCGALRARPLGFELVAAGGAGRRGSVSGTAGSDEAEGGGACGDGVAAPVLTAGMTAAANGADGVDAAAVTVDDWGAPVGAS